MKQKEFSIVRRNKIKAQIIELIERIPIDSHVCKQAGISRSTLYRWLEQDPYFQREFTDSKQISMASVSDIAESNLIKMINDGNITAIIFWLKSHRAAYTNNYIKRSEVKVPYELSTQEAVLRSLDRYPTSF